ncbi:MAG: hypothetical protein NVS3B20_04770 [Polyangiales bacterium]
MTEPKVPDDEAARQAALNACGIVDSAPEDSFDDLARVASEVCEAPVALVSFIDGDRQWFKARVNFDPQQTPRRISFCAHAIHHPEALVVRDLHQDARFSDNPLVTDPPNFRFYAGVPLHVDAGSAVGTLCVLDYRPRELNETQMKSLQLLGKQIARELRLRRDLARATIKPALPVEVGDLVGSDLRVVRHIGTGASGAVFEGRSDDGRRAAIKVLLPVWALNEQLLERFVLEARVLKRLSSPHVGGLIDVGNLDQARGGLPYLVLEYLEGSDLAQLLSQRGRIPLREAVEWARDACDGVGDAHALGVIHRDLKPSNLFLANTPNGAGTIKVLDFGIARMESASGSPHLTRAETLVGTPHYMSPEQMVSSHDVDERSDVWSMGAVLYELVTGQLPFAGSSEMEVFAKVLSKPPMPMRAYAPDVPAELDAIIRKCLRRDPQHRYPSIRLLRDALARVPVAPVV